MLSLYYYYYYYYRQVVTNHNLINQSHYPKNEMLYFDTKH